MYAHITKIKTGYQLRITNSARPIGGILYVVPGKREARALCAQLNARAWNF